MRNRLILAASGLILATGAPALAQSGGTRGSTPADRDVRAGTSGYGSTDGSSITVGGTADAQAADGGTANTRTRAKVNEQRGMQHSTATARDDDERARSRTHTVVRQGEVVRSRTSTMYKQKGERPERTTDVYRSDKPN
jgi:hypothetical protein